MYMSNDSHRPRKLNVTRKTAPKRCRFPRQAEPIADGLSVVDVQRLFRAVNS